MSDWFPELKTWQVAVFAQVLTESYLLAAHCAGSIVYLLAFAAHCMETDTTSTLFTRNSDGAATTNPYRDVHSYLIF